MFLDAVFWILRTGAPWRDLPANDGDGKNTHRRFCRWRDKGVWAQLLAALVTEPDDEGLMIDATHTKVHPDAAGARGDRHLVENAFLQRKRWRGIATRYAKNAAAFLAAAQIRCLAIWARIL